MVPLFRASEGVLAKKMVTLATTVMLLKQMSIIPSLGVCCTCDMPCDTEYKRNGTWLYWQSSTAPAPLARLVCVFCGKEISDKDNMISHIDECMETEDRAQTKTM